MTVKQANKTQAKNAIQAVFGTLSTTDVERLAHATKTIETANAHYGLNSQVAANQNFDSIVRDVLDRMSDYYIRELIRKLDIFSEYDLTDGARDDRESGPDMGVYQSDFGPDGQL